MNSTPLALVHGFPLDHTMWSAVRRALPSSLRVIAPDLPGFGGEPILSSPPSMEGYADFIARLLDQEHIREVVIAGVSMGGYAALAFAKQYPHRVKGLALVDSQTVADSPEAAAKRMEQIEAIRSGRLQFVVAQFLPKLFGPNGAGFHAYASECAEKAGVTGLSWALQAMAERADLTHFLQNSKFPVSIIHAKQDSVIPIDQAHELATRIRGSLWTPLQGGHTSPLESPQGVAQALEQLTQLANSGGRIVSDSKQFRPGLVWSPTDRGL